MQGITSRAFSGVSLDLLTVLSTPSTGEPLNSFLEMGTHGDRSHKKSERRNDDIIVNNCYEYFFQHGVPNNGLRA